MTLEKIGRYVIKSQLGRGGMSTVYLGHDPMMDRDVAIKLLPREFLHHEQFRERFNREARIIAALEHPAIVPIYDFGEESGQPFFVMCYMRGGSLAEKIKDRPLSIDETAKILQRIGSALDHAHERGIVHRDLKPANILFDQYGQAYLGDFGIARLQETGATLTGTVHLGTPAYMSPEQVQAKSQLDGRADIYALGVIIYEVLTGAKPFHAQTAAGLALKHLTEPIPRILQAKPNLPANMDQVITKAMAKDPNDRFPTAAELLMAMQSLSSGRSLPPQQPAAVTGARAAAEPATPEPVEEVEEAKPAAGRRRLPLIIGGVILLMVVCGGLAAGAYILLTGDDSPFAESATETPTITPEPSDTATATRRPTNTPPPTNTTIPTRTPAPTNTATPVPEPTETPPEPTLRPTNTPVPTNTPAPLPTSTPVPPTPTPEPPTPVPQDPPTPTPIPP